MCQLLSASCAASNFAKPRQVRKVFQRHGFEAALDFTNDTRLDTAEFSHVLLGDAARVASLSYYLAKSFVKVNLA